MRIRSLKPEFFSDRVTGRFPLDLMMFYAALWCFADDAGRFEWEPELIRCTLFPFHPDLDTEELLYTLVESGRVVYYESGGVHFGAIRAFEKHQHPDKKRESSIPAPPSGPGEKPPRLLPEDSPTPPRPITAGGDRIGGASSCSEPPTSAASEPPPSPEVASLPCVGPGAHRYSVTEAQVAAWSNDYPDLNIRGEVMKARAWLEANRAKRKTANGCPRFLVNWFNRAQNRGGGNGRAQQDSASDREMLAALEECERYYAPKPRRLEPSPPRGDGGPPPSDAAEDGVAEDAGDLQPALGPILDGGR